MTFQIKNGRITNVDIFDIGT